MAAKSDLAIASGQPTELVFVVDNVEYTKTQFEEKFEGYEVEFLSDKKDQVTFDKDGKVTATENFKYAVQVTTPEGEKIPTSVVNTHFEEVKVVDADKATKVIEIGLVQGKDAWKNATVTTADKVKIEPTVFANGLGTTTADQDENGALTEEATALAEHAPEIANITSSNPAVAFYEKDKGIQVRKDGKVTFTVEFEDKDIEALQTTVEVTTVAEQTATSIQAKDLKVKADAETAVKFDVLDQNGEKLRTEAKVFVAVKPEGKKEAEATEVTATAGAATTDLTFAKGNNVVTVYGADKENAVDKEVVLGTFKVEAVDVSADAKIEKYKLVNNNKDEEGNVKPLDLNVDEDVNNTTLELDVEAYIKDIKVDLKKDVTLVAKSSDAKVIAFADDAKEVTVTDEAKVTATAKAAGKSVITLYTKEGDLLTPVTTYEVEVTDSTKPVETLTLKDNTKVIVKKEATEEDLKQAVQDAVKEEKIADKIAKVETVVADGIVIVTMKEAYGGKEFTLNAIYSVVELKGAAYDTLKLTLTFSEAVKLEGDFKVTVKAEEGKETTLPVTKATLGTTKEGKEDNTKVVVELSEDVEGTQTITKIEGVQAVKGIVIVPEEGVTFEGKTETE